MFESAYGEINNNAHVVFLREMSNEDQLRYIQKLWQKDSDTYYEWKEWCMKNNELPELFGTRDNPIHIDESKL